MVSAPGYAPVSSSDPSSADSEGQAEEQVLTLRVEAEDAGVRLDRFLSLRVRGLGRANAAKLCATGATSVDQRPRPKSYLLIAGQSVRVRLGPLGRALPAPDVPLHVVWETADLVVVDKAAGIPCGALLGKEGGTLAGALLYRYPEMAEVGHSPREPGLIHRIDNMTSGLVLAARNTHAFALLSRALSEGRLKKQYLALVAPGSLPDSGRIDSPLKPDPKHRRRVAIRHGGRSCLTNFSVVKRGTTADLVQVAVHTAYRHQIRSHLAHLGAPLLGDSLYGTPHPRLGNRHALHASYIGWEGSEPPAFEASSELPDDLASVLG